MEFELAELFDLQMGKTPARNEPKYWENGNNRWMSIADLSTIDKFIDNTKECISDLALQDTKIYRIPENTVVMSFKLSIGKVAITKCPMYSNEAIVSFLPKKGVNVLANYLYYVLKAKRWDDAGNKAVKGVTLNKISLSRAKIRLHDLEEQKHICNILDELSAAVRLRRIQLAKLDELVKARFVEMFGDPVSNPLQWPTNKLQKVAPHKPVAFQESKSIWLLNLDMIESNTGRIIDYKYTSSDNIGSSTCCFDASHVLYSKLRPYLNKVVVPRQFGVATSELLALRPNSSLNRIFLANLLRGDFFVRFISEKVSGAKMPRVAMDIFWAFPCIIPPMELQRRFADFVQQVDKSKVAVPNDGAKKLDLRIDVC